MRPQLHVVIGKSFGCSLITGDGEIKADEDQEGGGLEQGEAREDGIE